MRNPINSGQVLLYTSVLSVVGFMLAANLVWIKKNTNYIPLPALDVQHLSLANRTELTHLKVAPFSSIRISAQFLDTIIFEPASQPGVEIRGDLNLVNNLRHYQTSRNELIIERKKAFWVDSLKDRASYEFNFQGLLEKGGLSMKVYYTELKGISVEGDAKLILQKGVLRGPKVSIAACAKKASFNVETKNLELYLSRPYVWVDSLGHRIHPAPGSIQEDLQTITGTADLVQVNPQSSPASVDLSKVTCRHVHCLIREGIKDRKIIAAPSQLLSYFAYSSWAIKNVDVICKSNAKVSYAYEDPRSRRIIRIK